MRPLVDAITVAAQRMALQTTLMMRIGPVTKVQASVVTVAIGGTDTPCALVAGLTAAVGDRLVVLTQAGASVAINKLA